MAEYSPTSRMIHLLHVPTSLLFLQFLIENYYPPPRRAQHRAPEFVIFII